MIKQANKFRMKYSYIQIKLSCLPVIVVNNLLGVSKFEDFKHNKGKPQHSWPFWELVENCTAFTSSKH